MLKRIVLGCMMILVCLLVPNRAWPQEKSPSPLRILVEGEGTISRSIIEAVRRANAKNDIKLEFVSGVGGPYDLRLLVSSGYGTASGSCSCSEGSSSYSETIYHTTVNALTASGKLLIMMTHASDVPSKANNEVATAVIQNIIYRFESIQKESIANAKAPQETINQIESKEAVKSSAEEPPKEPGVYYRDGTNWILLAESLPTTKVRGMGRALLTVMLASVRFYDVYSGTSAQVQIREQKPEFYVRDFPIAHQELAIVQLKKEKDRREVHSSSVSLLRGSGHKNVDLHKLKATRISNDVYKLVPEDELQPGEYVLDLYISDTDTGVYEFGIVGSKK
jgi:hypothetical protein